MEAADLNLRRSGVHAPEDHKSPGLAKRVPAVGQNTPSQQRLLLPGVAAACELPLGAAAGRVHNLAKMPKR